MSRIEDLIEQGDHVVVWGSSFTMTDDDGWPVKGGGVIVDGVLVCGEEKPSDE